MSSWTTLGAQLIVNPTEPVFLFFQHRGLADLDSRFLSDFTPRSFGCIPFIAMNSADEGSTV